MTNKAKVSPTRTYIPKWRLIEIRKACSPLNGVTKGKRYDDANVVEDAIILAQWHLMSGNTCYYDAVCALINAK